MRNRAHDADVRRGAECHCTPPRVAFGRDADARGHAGCHARLPTSPSRTVTPVVPPSPAVRRAFDPDRVFWSLTALLVLLDAWTKWMAQSGHPWLAALGGWWGALSFPLTYNPGVAFSLRVDAHAVAERWLYVATLTWVLVFLYALHRRVAHASPTTMIGLALMHGGGAGNLLDRLRHERGVVDFIHVDAGALAGLVFNVADVAAACGGMLLLWALARRECAPGRRRQAGG